MINFILRTVLPPGTFEVDETHKFDDILDLTQFFQIWPGSVLIEMNDARNNVIDNFKLHDKLSRIYSFQSKRFWSWQNSANLQKKSFLVNFRGSLRENSASLGVGHSIQSCCK